MKHDKGLTFASHLGMSRAPWWRVRWGVILPILLILGGVAWWFSTATAGVEDTSRVLK
ncbi:MAG: hypothetical protein HYV42_05705 [Candidatus Magasanikbacteria bacterium]|nr:hypothetical protein [Candidatus Magasanikbacteria bacterium]